MPSIDTRLATQLVNASALAYYSSPAEIKSSPYFAGSQIIDPSPMRQFSVGINSVIMALTPAGIVISFRGTIPPDQTDPELAIAAAKDWLNDAKLKLVSVPYAEGKVHTGFADSLDSLWQNLSVSMSAFPAGSKIYVTGHSKGGAIAALAAARFIKSGITPAAVITFGAPKAGDEDFAAAYNSAMPNHWRVEHNDDVVPHLPPRPAVLLALKQLEQFGAFFDLLKKLELPIGDYTPVGNLSFLDWNNQLDEDDSIGLEFEREARMIVAGTELVTDHYIDGYIGAMSKAFSTLPPA